MAKRVQKEKQATSSTEDSTPADLPTGEQAEELKDEIDDLLDEIDSVLEENAEDFVRGYIQKGGE